MTKAITTYHLFTRARAGLQTGTAFCVQLIFLFLLSLTFGTFKTFDQSVHALHAWRPFLCYSPNKGPIITLVAWGTEGLCDLPKAKAGFSHRAGKPIQAIYSPQRRAEVQRPSVLHPFSNYSPTTLLPAYENNPDTFISLSPPLITTLGDIFTRRAHGADLIIHLPGVLTVMWQSLSSLTHHYLVPVLSSPSAIAQHHCIHSLPELIQA